LSTAANLNEAVSTQAARTLLSTKQTKVEKLPPLDSGPIYQRNRLDSTACTTVTNMTKYSSENSIAPSSTFLTRRFSSTRNCSLPRTFGNIGGMGRHSYRPGCPVGWKAPQQ
jgi:predicted extracellular nuclease